MASRPEPSSAVPSKSFEHRGLAMTVGMLRAELEGLPDDMPVTAYVTAEPGGETVNQRVVAGRALSLMREGGQEEATATGFGLLIDYPPGAYTRRVWRR